MIRVWGVLAVFGGCCAVGILEGRQSWRRLRVVQDILHGLDIVEQETALNRRPLSDMLRMVANTSGNGLACKLFQDCAAEAEKGNAFTYLVENFVAKMELEQHWKQELCAMFDMLGQYDADGQVKLIAQARTRLQALQEQARQQAGAKSRVCSALGAAVGGVLSVMLI